MDPKAQDVEAANDNRQLEQAKSLHTVTKEEAEPEEPKKNNNARVQVKRKRERAETSKSNGEREKKKAKTNPVSNQSKRASDTKKAQPKKYRQLSPSPSKLDSFPPYSLLEVLSPTLLVKEIPHASNFIVAGPVRTLRIIKQSSRFIVEKTGAKLADVKRTLRQFIDVTLQDCENMREKGGSDPYSREHVAATMYVSVNRPNYGRAVPRWHREGPQWISYDPEQFRSKYAVTLLGSPTRLLVETEYVTKVVDMVRDVAIPGFNMRTEYSKKLVGPEVQEIQIKTGQVIRFTWGRKNSPVHSYGDLSGPRVFVSIVYGSEAEIRDYCDYSSLLNKPQYKVYESTESGSDNTSDEDSNSERNPEPDTKNASEAFKSKSDNTNTEDSNSEEHAESETENEPRNGPRSRPRNRPGKGPGNRPRNVPENDLVGGSTSPEPDHDKNFVGTPTGSASS